MPQEPKSCGVLLVCGDPLRSFLLMKHADRWDLPKGHVDPGESDLECALREMEEETGIQRTDVHVDPTFRFVQQYEVVSKRYGGSESKPVLKTLIIFLATVEREYPIQVTEHLDARWFKWSAPPAPIQLRTIDPVLQHLSAHLQRSSPAS